jgi:hypothetical protein
MSDLVHERLAWNVLTNDGRVLTAINTETGEAFDGTTSDFNALLQTYTDQSPLSFYVGNVAGTVAAGDHNHSGVYAAFDPDLPVLANLIPADGSVIIGDGTAWTTESGGTLRSSLGLGTAATTASTDYAPSAKGVTNGDSHDHSGGDGGTVAYSTLSGLPAIGNVLNQAQQALHGFVNRTSTTLAFDNSTHVVTLGVATTATIYINGVPYTLSSPGLSIDLDTKTLATGLWFVWIEVSNNVPVLNASQLAWSITNTSAIPTLMLYWNGTSGAIMDERHAAERNLALHTYLHLTVGARIQNDGSFAQVRPTTALDGQLELTSGVLWDEDIANIITTAQGKLVRNWYETASGVWAFADGVDNAGYDRPYLWNTALQYPRTDSAYALSNVANNKYLPVWVYASNDVARPIYVVTKSYTLAALNNYSSVTAARADVAPVLPFVPELKLLYRFIYRGDGEYQESADYRTSASLPSGGVTAPTASSVSFAPSGNIESTNVQSAIEEIDFELNLLNVLSAINLGAR